jgi:hypothetical protein
MYSEVMKQQKKQQKKQKLTLDVDLESGMCLNEERNPRVRPTTSIADLMHSDTLDISNMTVDYTRGISRHTVLTMKDYYSRQTLGIATEDQCMWDRHPFQTTPIGIPLRYCPQREKRSYFTKKMETKNTKKGKTEVVVNETPMVKIDETPEYFETDGVVCSFPCALALIRQEVRHDKRYRESESLLYFMYKLLHDIPMNERVKIPVAGTWKMISGCGGDMPISQYRQNYCRMVYDITPSVKRPLMIPVSHIVEVSPLN